MLTREQILALPDLPHKDVPVPEWGEGATIRVRALNGKERDAWEGLCFRDGKAQVNDNLRAKLLVFACVKNDGTRIFTDTDVEELGQKNSIVLTRLWEAAAELSKLRGKDAEQAVKN